MTTRTRRVLSLGLTLLGLAGGASAQGAAPIGRVPRLAGAPGAPEPAGRPDSAPSVLLGAESRAKTFEDLPAAEIPLAGRLPAIAGLDAWTAAHARTTGEVAVLSLEASVLKAAYSADGGVTYGAEVVVAGGAGQPPVRGPVSALAPDGKLYVVYGFGNVGGDVGLRVRRSDDMGRTWLAPVDIVAPGDATFGVADSPRAIAANGSTVAVLYVDAWEGRHGFARVSTDSGATFARAVRLDAGDTLGRGVKEVDVAVDGSARIHAIFVQDRGSAAQVWYARSLTGGASFSAEVSFDSLLVVTRTGSARPDVAIGNDGGVLIAFWDASDYVYVLRSADAGVTFARTLAGGVPDNPTPCVPSLGVSNVNIVFAIWTEPAGLVRYARSTNNAATFGITNTLVGGYARNARITRTQNSYWAVAWEDYRTTTTYGATTAMYVQTTSNGGTSWLVSPPQVERDDGLLHAGVMGSLVAVGNDALLVVYRDSRPDARSASVYASRSLAASAYFPPSADRRVDGDGPDDAARVNSYPGVATDGADRVYAVFLAAATGTDDDLYVAVSADRGRTFGDPVRVSTHAPGSRFMIGPSICATPDGAVYVTSLRQRIAGTSPAVDVVLNRSLDFGATWLASDKVVGGEGDLQFYDLACAAGGKAYVAFENFDNIQLARSTDGFATFTTADVDQNTTGYNTFPRLCAQGDQVVLAWMTPNPAITYWSVWATVSSDAAATWSPRVHLRAGALGGVDQALACDGGQRAVVAWEDYRDPGGAGQIFANRYDGAQWSGEVGLATPAPGSYAEPSVAFYGANEVAVASTDGTAVYVHRSTDAGLTWGLPQRLDDAAPQPLADSFSPFVASDGAGRLWAAWVDGSAGNPSVAVRASSDGGGTFSQVRRADRALPQGFPGQWINSPGMRPVAAAPGVFYLAFSGERGGTIGGLLNSWDLGDADRDGVPAASDCNDADPGASATPAEVTNLAVARATGAARLTWDSQAAGAGSGTRYDLATGDAAALVAGAGFGGASCLAGAAADAPYDDVRGGPVTGAAFWYLARARNACAAATYGDSGLEPDPRDALDASSPCP